MAYYSGLSEASRHGALHPRLLWAIGLVMAIVPLGCSASASTTALGPTPAHDVPVAVQRMAPVPPPPRHPSSAAAHILTRTAELLSWDGTSSGRSDLPDANLQVQGNGCNALVSVAAEEDCPTMDCPSRLLSMLGEQGLTRGLYRGWEAIISRAGDPLPEDGRTTGHGLIAWHQGRYTFMAEDTTGSGREAQIAEALFSAAREVLGGPGGTVVLLAEGEERHGQITLAQIGEMAEAANTYYQYNAYGRVAFDFTFLDADGDAGNHDWYTLDSSSRHSDPYAWGLAALGRACAEMDLPEEVYLERAIVVYPGASKQSGSSGAPYSEVFSRLNAEPLEIAGPQRSSKVHLSHLVLLAEEDELGAWVHELGHTLYSCHPAPGGYGLSDRYGYDEAGTLRSDVGLWDVMGLGSYWGSPMGSAPVQMSSYSKEAAGWLHYREAAPGTEYTLGALEGQRASGAVLRLKGSQGYYIIEARDYQGPYGSPETGVLIYQVTYDAATQRTSVDLLPPQTGDTAREQYGLHYQRPTLRGAATPQGAHEYVDAAGGVRITLLGESFSPYRATVRIERA